MLAVVVFLNVVVYFLFFEDANSISNDFLNSEPPLIHRLLAIGFLCVLFLLGLAQQFLLQRRLRTPEDPQC